MNSKRGIVGMFVAMFFATIFIVMILLIMIVGSGFVKKIQERDNFGVQNESDVGLDNIFNYTDGQFYNITKLRSYVDYRFNDMAQLRIIVEKDGDWEGWLMEEMKR